jgi:rsbT co-antagonist protein RsbR
VLVGIRPEVAQSIVGLGVDLQSIRTFSDLQSALDRVAA